MGDELTQDAFNPLAGVLRIFEKKIEADAASRAREVWLDQQARYGVDELGRVYLRGQASGAGKLQPISPMFVAAGAVIALGLLLWALKR